jgi:hypothetical protein
VNVVTSGLMVQLPGSLIDQAMRVLWEAASKSPEGTQLLGDATMSALANLAKGGALVSGTKRLPSLFVAGIPHAPNPSPSHRVVPEQSR